MGVKTLAKAAEETRRAWMLWAATNVSENIRIVHRRVRSELEGVVAPEYGKRLKELDGQMRAVGVDERDFYSAMKERERRSQRKSTD